MIVAETSFYGGAAPTLPARVPVASGKKCKRCGGLGVNREPRAARWLESCQSKCDSMAREV